MYYGFENKLYYPGNDIIFFLDYRFNLFFCVQLEAVEISQVCILPNHSNSYSDFGKLVFSY